MKNFDTEFTKYTQKIKLKAAERRELRERIFTFMEYHPLPKDSTEVSEEFSGAILSEKFSTFHFNTLYLRVVSGVMVLLVIATPFMAERSVPGDVLYLVKTGITEPFQGQLASSPYEKIEFETKLMERRIAEARVLATEGKLTEEVQTQIAETVKGHTKAVQQGIAELREQDAESAALATIAFNSSLEVQSAILEATVSAVATDTVPVASILTVVNDAHEENTATQEDTPSYDNVLAQVERETTRAYELLSSVKISATEEEVSDINRRLSDIDRLVVEAKERRDTDPDRATTEIASTLGLIQKLITFMSDIDVREVVALENLVPVILSDEERIAFVRGEIDTLENVLTPEITARLELLTEEGVREKVEEGLRIVAENVLKATMSLEISDISAAENAIHEARAYMTDIDVLTQPVENTTTDTPTQEAGEQTEESVETDTTTDTQTETGTSTESVPTESTEDAVTEG